jgi:hypothetical protein
VIVALTVGQPPSDEARRKLAGGALLDGAWRHDLLSLVPPPAGYVVLLRMDLVPFVPLPASSQYGVQLH